MRKVVIVEDEGLVRRGIVQAVDWASVGFEVAGEAENGEQALAVIRRCAPDLVITDIRMPRMDGLEMLRRLRGEGNPVSVIILTAYSDFTYAQSAIKLGVVDFLLKPFKDGELEAAVSALMARAAPHGRHDELLIPESDTRSRYVSEVLRMVEEGYASPELSVGSIAEALGVTEGHLSHVFRKETSCKLSTYIALYRIREAKRLLDSTQSRVNEVAEQVGYRDITYFSRKFRSIVGLSPSEYKKQAGVRRTGTD